MPVCAMAGVAQALRVGNPASMSIAPPIRIVLTEATAVAISGSSALAPESGAPASWVEPPAPAIPPPSARPPAAPPTPLAPAPEVPPPPSPPDETDPPEPGPVAKEPPDPTSLEPAVLAPPEPTTPLVPPAPGSVPSPAEPEPQATASNATAIHARFVDPLVVTRP